MDKRTRIAKTKFSSEEDAVKPKKKQDTSVWENDSLTLAEKLLKDNKQSGQNTFNDYSESKVLCDSVPSVVNSTIPIGNSSASPVKKKIKQENNGIGSLIVCHLCDKSFRFNIALERHMRKVHLQKEDATGLFNTGDEDVEMTGGEIYEGKNVFKIPGKHCETTQNQGPLITSSEKYKPCDGEVEMTESEIDEGVNVHKIAGKHSKTTESREALKKSSKKNNKIKQNEGKKNLQNQKKTQMEFSCSLCHKTFAARLSLVALLKKWNVQTDEDSESEPEDVNIATKEPLQSRRTMYIERRLKEGNYELGFSQFHQNSVGAKYKTLENIFFLNFLKILIDKSLQTLFR